MRSHGELPSGYQGTGNKSDIPQQHGLPASHSNGTSTPPEIASGVFSSVASPFRTMHRGNKIEQITASRDFPLGQPLDVETGDGRTPALPGNDVEWDEDTITKAIEHYGWTMVGRGGFGTVFKGNHPVHGDVAVKILDRATISRELYRHEVENMEFMSRNPECIVQLKAKSSAYSKEMVIVTEWMEGGSLTGQLKKNPDWLSRLKTMQGVAACLESIHSQSLPHCNLKPGRHIGLPASFWQPHFCPSRPGC